MGVVADVDYFHWALLITGNFLREVVLHRDAVEAAGSEHRHAGDCGLAGLTRRIKLCYLGGAGSTQVQFAVGFKIQGKTGHVVVDAEDALIAALKVKMQLPEALIANVRQQNKRGDTRHPMRRLSSENA